MILLQDYHNVIEVLNGDMNNLTPVWSHAQRDIADDRRWIAIYKYVPLLWQFWCFPSDQEM